MTIDETRPTLLWSIIYKESVLKFFLECVIEFGDKDLILFLLEHSANVNKHILFPEDEDIKLDAVTGKKTLEGATSRIRRGILFF